MNKNIFGFGLAILLSFVFVYEVHSAAGDLDPEFDNDGKVTTGFTASSDEQIEAIALQLDGKVIAAGTSNNDFAVARYNSDGSLDPSFDFDGKLTTDFGGSVDQALAIVVQPDGKIVVAGGKGNIASDDFALARYNPDGSLDPTFGTAGKVITNHGLSDQASAVILQPDGKIIIGGKTANDFVVVRYNSDGSLDNSFDFDGIVTTDFQTSSDSIEALVLQPDGKIIAAGLSVLTTNDFALARYNPDGTLDSSFNFDGKLNTDFAGDIDIIRAVLLQPDGKIVAAGRSRLPGGDPDFALARYLADGTLDNSFNDDGKVTTDIAVEDVVNSVLLQQDNKIIVAGLTSPNGSNLLDFALARYHSDGSLDIGFGSNGIVATNFTGNFALALGAALQQDGKVVAGGSASNNGDSDFALARYLGDTIQQCTFCDDYQDGILAPDWTYVKPSWSEVGGNLIGTPTGRKAETIANPIFSGCTNCSVETSMSSSGGIGNRLWLLGWFIDKRNAIEVLMKEENDKWILKQRSNGSVVAKTSASSIIQPNTFYNVKVSFDGINFSLTVDGILLTTMPAFASPNGTVGFRAKNTTGMFGFINVN